MPKPFVTTQLLLIATDVAYVIQRLRTIKPLHGLLACVLAWICVSNWTRGMLWASYQLVAKDNATVVMLLDTGSMEPTFDTRDILIVQQCTPNEIGSGDILSFQLPSHFQRRYGVSSVLHRVVGRTKAGWVTKGDNNETADEWIVEPSWLRGKVVASYRI